MAEVAVKEGVSEHEKDLSGPALFASARGTQGLLRLARKAPTAPHRTNINETSASPRTKGAACG